MCGGSECGPFRYRMVQTFFNSSAFFFLGYFGHTLFIFLNTSCALGQISVCYRSVIGILWIFCCKICRRLACLFTHFKTGVSFCAKCTVLLTNENNEPAYVHCVSISVRTFVSTPIPFGNINMPTAGKFNGLVNIQRLWQWLTTPCIVLHFTSFTRLFSTCTSSRSSWFHMFVT